MRVCSAVIVLVAITSAAGRALAAQPVPIGSEFRINHARSDYDFDFDGYAFTPKVASFPDGEFVVVWEGNTYENYLTYGSGYRVFGRRYDSAGNPKGAEFGITPLDSSYFKHPNVGVDQAGNFVVAWSNAGQVYARRYDPDGNPVDAAITANVGEALTNTQNQVGLAVEGGGGFVVTWEGGQNLNQAFARRFDTASIPLGPEFQVNTSSPWVRYTTVAGNAAGDFVVTWSYGGVGAQWYDATGTPVGGEFIALDAPTDELAAGVACAADRICMAVSGIDAVARLFDGTGTPLGPRFDVAPGGQFSAVAADADGTFVVVYQNTDGFGEGPLYGQHFDHAGQPDGVPVLVSPKRIAQPQGISVPAVAADARGDFVVVWADSYDRDYQTSWGLFGRRFGLCGNGKLSPALPCDDGNTAPNDGCNPACDVETCFTCAGEPSTCGTIAACDVICSDAARIDPRVILIFNKLLPPAGDETVTLRGAIMEPPLAAGASDPSVTGVEVAITGANVLYQLAGATRVPPGLVGAGCGPLDGWKVTGRSPNRNYTYKNLTNALPPGCVPGSANGVRIVKVKDRIAKDGTIGFEVRAKNTTLPAIPGAPVVATIVLGQGGSPCARTTFTQAFPSSKTVRFIP